MQILKGTTLLDRSFQTSITLKGLDGLLEIFGGLLFLGHNPARVNAFVAAITQHTLSTDPHDFIATHLLHASQGMMGGSRYFFFFYLVSHGLTKVILVTALWLNRMWAYPAMILLLLAFIAYQLYRMTFAPSWFLVLLTLFDAVVIWLTWEEYKKQRPLCKRRQS
ncbi:MAG TPA: DUF2127 domain-containing protein [Candidatus Acidoferrales bacterium]|nr:DUF2127 domain-containing protein [Candidatus Acidoferrales bacterium]